MTSPADFVDESESSQKGAYKWCTETGDCKQAMCALVDASLKKDKIYDNLKEDTDRVELVDCDDATYFGDSFTNQFNDYLANHKVKYIDPTVKDAFRMTQLGILTELGDGALMEECYDLYLKNNDTFCPDTDLTSRGSATHTLIPSICTHRPGGGVEEEIPGFICQKNQND